MGFIRFYEAVSLGMVMPPSMMNVTFALGPFSLSASCSALEALAHYRKALDILRSFENRK